MKRKLFLLLCALLTMIGVQAQTAWTGDITNADGLSFTTKYADPSNHDVAETWTSTSSTTHAFDVNQSLTSVPDGVYELSAQAMYRASLTYGTATNCVLYATVGETTFSTPIANFADYTANEDRAQIGTQMQNNNAYLNIVPAVIVEGGNVTIGMKSVGELAYCTNGYWFVYKKSTFTFKNVTTTYHAKLVARATTILATAPESTEKTALSDALTTYATANFANVKALQSAINTFLETATASNPLNVTDYITNPSFSDNSGNKKNWIQDLGYKQPSDIYQPTGWNMLYSSEKVNNTQYQTYKTQTDGAKDNNCYYVRQRWGDVYAKVSLHQLVKELPAGAYRVTVAVKGGSSVTDANILGAKAGSNSNTTTVDDFDKSNYKDYSVQVNKTDANADIDISFAWDQKSGVEQLYYVDDFRLYFLGDPVKAKKAELEALQATIDDNYLNNPTYVNVGGTERSTLNTQKTATAASETVEAYQTVIDATQDAIDAFVAGKTNYDQYAEAAAVATAVGATSVTAPTTSAEALTRSHELYVNIDTKVTATYTYDATAIYSGSFGGTFTSTNTSQHWSGDGSKAYYDNYGSGNISATQTVTLPAGSYVIKVAGRGSADAVDHKIYVSANGTTVTFANNGDTGRGITKTGLVKYDAADDTYCNSNNGRGWEWRFIPLTLADETDVMVTVSFDRSGSTWGGFCDFTILLNSAEDADDDDYAALNAAISTAEAKTLGFEDGEFAPYNNVKALTTLALAKDIDQDGSNPKSAINSITATLISSWTANDGEVNAFSNNGYFQSNINAIGWKNTNWIQQEGNYLCVPSGSSVTYGETAAYTMPLKADTYYVLTFRHASWDTSNKDYGGSVSVLLNEDGLAATAYTGNPDYYKGDDTNYKKESFVFQTGAAGNYVLTLTGGSGRTTVKDFVLKEAESATMQISATAKMGTFCAPFDVSIPSSVTAYTLSAGASANWVHMTEVTGGTIEAGTPVLVAAPEIGETLTQTFHGNYTADPKNTGVLRGVYEKTDLTAGVDYLLQYQGGVCAFYKVTNTGFRVGKNRCYLHIDGGGSARIALGEEDDPTTAINEVEAIKAEAKTMKDGKYLVKGRIVIVNNGKAFGANGQILK